MKKIITLISLTAVVYACSSSKKSSKTTSGSASAVAAKPSETSVNSSPVMLAKPANGIYAPGEEELTAIKTVKADATMEQLSRGYKIYTEGACIKCHAAKDIYRRDEARWKNIIDKMSEMAKISDEDKTAVYHYVLAVKALQQK